MYLIGYFGASFLLTYFFAWLFTIPKVKKLPEEEVKHFKKVRMIITLLISIVLGIALIVISSYAKTKI